ncbi:Aste57867_2881 [Aphanomyces stellatus]|uniref:Aste57867_2881 protein n=1 Tax=Aphanomyces stellatus TaxID=120398 RepID=A0A485KA61_9STRA|nr:hypothetical protein As57867_002873 [Aphanomyces stellatus]VFT80065.1 Aste57867_2881 [Aphanomyces stellatus]
MTRSTEYYLRRRRGQCQFRLWAFTDAIADLNAALVIARHENRLQEMAYIHCDLAAVFQYNDSSPYSRAFEHINHSIEMYPMIQTYFLRAELYYARKDTQSALADLVRVEIQSTSKVDILARLCRATINTFWQPNFAGVVEAKADLEAIKKMVLHDSIRDVHV